MTKLLSFPKSKEIVDRQSKVTSKKFIEWKNEKKILRQTKGQLLNIIQGHLYKKTKEELFKILKDITNG